MNVQESVLSENSEKRAAPLFGSNNPWVRWQTMPLRRRFAMFIGGVVLGTVGAYTAALFISEAHHFRQQAISAHWKSVRLLAHACGVAMINRDELSVLNYFKEMQKAYDFKEAACLNDQNAIWLDSDVSRIGLRLTDSGGLDWRREGEDERWEYRVPVLRKGERLATARVVYDGRITKKEVHHLLALTARRSLGVPAVALVLALGLAWLTARTLTRPILGMAAGARRLAQGDWTSRVRTDAPGELGDLAREFNHMSEQLGELDRLKEQFLHTVSHDLRNPLSAVITSVRLLRNDRVPVEFGPLINIIEASVVRLQTMASNLLDTARLREGGLTFHFQWVEVPPLASELTRLYQALADKAGKTIDVDVPPDLPRLWADEEKVLRILLNLVSNAFKFTRTRDRISLTARAIPGAVEFQVSDTGWGIPPEQKERLFQPFHSMKGARPETLKGQGSGLGLSIVKQLVEGHGGQITVASTEGKGTTFTFSLPVEKRTS